MNDVLMWAFTGIGIGAVAVLVLIGLTVLVMYAADVWLRFWWCLQDLFAGRMVWPHRKR